MQVNHKGRITYNRNDVQNLPKSFKSNRFTQQRAQGATIFKELAHCLVGADSIRSIKNLPWRLWGSTWDVLLMGVDSIRSIKNLRWLVSRSTWDVLLMGVDSIRSIKNLPWLFLRSRLEVLLLEWTRSHPSLVDLVVLLFVGSTGVSDDRESFSSRTHLHVLYGRVRLSFLEVRRTWTHRELD